MDPLRKVDSITSNEGKQWVAAIREIPGHVYLTISDWHVIRNQYEFKGLNSHLLGEVRFYCRNKLNYGIAECLTFSQSARDSLPTRSQPEFEQIRLFE